MTAITGHRGARNLWPENSLMGFRKAAELGCDAIEFDVHLTVAGELVVIHDPTLERTTEGAGEVANLLGSGPINQVEALRPA
ncbi:glycerophosphodiester phosphodiesterase family protein [Palleronia sp.]|uniref:glycerophosphodiester phosphodiesterase family protein n=1 Tax=Palleronia sp. TaxID=1940284 RepID=UPI0035C855EB